jgi:heme A synthase
VSILFVAHSWFRYLVLLVALAALVMLAYSVATGRSTRSARNLATAFAGVLDLQIVLGIALMMSGVYPDAVTGHLMLMVAAAVVTHGAFLVGQQSSTVRTELAVRLIGIVLALVLIVIGIMAIGQTLLGTSVRL